MNMVETSAFLKFWSLGYKRLVPIIPHDAAISERSSLAKRVGTHQDARGKSPGVRGRGEQWFGFDWIPHEADEDDLRRWQRMGAGVGVKTGPIDLDDPSVGHLLAIDADTLDADHARTIRDAVEDRFGRLPVRIGRYPKALYLIRTSGPLPYSRIEFGERDARGVPDRVEILSDGRQFVAHGIHPATKAPYEWPRGIPALETIPTVDAGTVTALLADLRTVLPAASEIIREGATTAVNQTSLKGDPAVVEKAVKAIPNTSEHFPSRESYRDIGYAIKAALPDDPEHAFDIFSDWCARWTDGDNDPDIVAADWRRMKPPYRRGAGWLYELAESISPNAFSAAEPWFDDLDELPANPFAEIMEREAKGASDTYPLLSIADLMNRPPPVWLVERHIPQQSVGFIYSEPGAGKSFIALDLALSIAHSLPQWHGDAINAGETEPAVIYIASEGSFDLGNRVQAWLNRRGLADNLSKRFLTIEQTVNFMSADDVNKLLRTLAAVAARIGRPALVVVDTVSRALTGADENLQKDMTRFVQACDAIRDAHCCAVLGIHHAGKAGDMRGSTVLLGAGDFVFRLSRKKGATIGEFWCEKQKAAPDGWNEHYRLEPATLGEGRSSLVVERCEGSDGASVTLTPDVASAVLEAMDAAWRAGAPWSKAPQARDRYAVRRMVSEFGFDGVRAEELLALWEATGVISVSVADSDSKMKGFKVKAGQGQAVLNDGIFG